MESTPDPLVVLTDTELSVLLQIYVYVVAVPWSMVI
jgi:hypothetical protein